MEKPVSAALVARFEGELAESQQLIVTQRKELAELLGVESRNKYEIVNARGAAVGFAAEQGHGFLAFLFRQALGHLRTFDVTFFDQARQVMMVAHHPFRWFFQRFEIRGPEGASIGSLQRRWGIFHRVFDLCDASDTVLLSVSSPLWKPWTFEFLRDGRPVAAVRKKWSGLLREAFLDADNFQIEFAPGPLSQTERKLLLAAAVFIDLIYFERKASSN
jgi:uncharacterized protein YxjI